MKIYTIHDNKADRYSQPFYEHNGTTALRAFKLAVNSNDPNNQLKTSPEDFDLIQIGEWDTETGNIAGTKRELIANATKVITE